MPYTTYEQVNKLLAAIGTTMRVNDDELIDQEENGGQPYRLYFDDFNTESSDPIVQQVLSGVVESGLAYSSYPAAPLRWAAASPLFSDMRAPIPSTAKSRPGTQQACAELLRSLRSGKRRGAEGRRCRHGHRRGGEGRVFLSGTVFCSNFEVAAEDQVSYSNGIIAQNILSMVQKQPEISTIQEARAGADGEVFTVIGTVANGTAESGNAFFNTIYIQDDEGNGINVFPIDDNTIRRGDQVMVTGSISEYIGDKQLPPSM